MTCWHACTSCKEPELLLQTVECVCSSISVQVRVLTACLIQITDVHDLLCCSGQWTQCWIQLWDKCGNRWVNTERGTKRIRKGGHRWRYGGGYASWDLLRRAQETEKQSTVNKMSDVSSHFTVSHIKLNQIEHSSPLGHWKLHWGPHWEAMMVWVCCTLIPNAVCCQTSFSSSVKSFILSVTHCLLTSPFLNTYVHNTHICRLSLFQFKSRCNIQYS